MRYTIILLVLFYLSSCSEGNADFYSLGLKSFRAENLSLAKNQFSMIKSNDPKYESARAYLEKIDSIQKGEYNLYKGEALVKQRIKDTLMKQHAGNYKIEVNGVSSKDAVEVYLLKMDGDADWLWVYDIDGIKKIDDRKNGWWSIQDSTLTVNITGNSGVIEEVYNFNDGYFRNVQIKKRFLVRTQKTF